MAAIAPSPARAKSTCEVPTAELVVPTGFMSKAKKAKTRRKYAKQGRWAAHVDPTGPTGVQKNNAPIPKLAKRFKEKKSTLNRAFYELQKKCRNREILDHLLHVKMMRFMHGLDLEDDIDDEGDIETKIFNMAIALSELELEIKVAEERGDGEFVEERSA